VQAHRKGGTAGGKHKLGCRKRSVCAGKGLHTNYSISAITAEDFLCMKYFLCKRDNDKFLFQVMV